MSRKSLHIAALAASILAGLLADSTILWIALREQNQGELYNVATGAVNWSYGATLFCVWFLVIAVPTFLVALAAVELGYRLIHREEPH
jgi:hypothetical protein